jgi:hypothetical protein
MLPKTAITVTRTSNSAQDGFAPIESTSTVLNGNRRVVIVPPSQVNPYGFQQMNNKAQYLVYFEIGDPEIKIGDDITFTLGGLRKKVSVNELKPMTLPIQNKNLEAYCDSTNN